MAINKVYVKRYFRESNNVLLEVELLVAVVRIRQWQNEQEKYGRG